MSERASRHPLARSLQRLRERTQQREATLQGERDDRTPPPAASVAVDAAATTRIDAAQLAREVARYLSAVDLFRAEGVDVRWAPERGVPEWWVTEWTVPR